MTIHAHNLTKTAQLGTCQDMTGGKKKEKVNLVPRQ